MKPTEIEYDHYALLADILESDVKGLIDFYKASKIANIFSFAEIMECIAEGDNEAATDYMTLFITENASIMYRAEYLEEYEIAADVKNEIRLMGIYVWRANKKYNNIKTTRKSTLKNLEDSVKESREFYYNTMINLSQPTNSYDYEDEDDNY